MTNPNNYYDVFNDRYNRIELARQRAQLEREWRQRWLTPFGRRHGGRETLIAFAILMKGITIVGAFALAMWLGNSNFSTTTKGVVLCSWVGCMFTVVLAAIWLYYKPRKALLIYGWLIALGVAGLGICYLLLALLVSAL